MSSPAEASPPLSVVVAIMVSDTAELPGILEAVGRQVYEPRRVVAVGGADASRAAVADLSFAGSPVGWMPSLEALIKSVDVSASHVWVIHDVARPKPDALQALVEEGGRADAGIAGSKLLRLHEPGQLISVGIATDVFEVPFVGLDVDEMDQGQYDVVRDVAAVGGASLLIRRDLMTGIGGADRSMGRQAAAVDLCQRARLRGARVVVVPSSEVLYPEGSGIDAPWKEEAGRIRAALKVYGPLTLAWVIPLLLLLGLLEAVVAPFLGRWALFSWARAWGWNLLYLPGTLRERRAARRGRVVGDEELFRYQIRGSVRLRELADMIGERVRRRFPEDARLGFAELGRDFQQPVVIVGLVVAAIVALGTRVIWSTGLPTAGYTMALPDSGAATLRAYAGGWNPAGLGSPEPLRPIVGLASLVQLTVLDHPGLAASLLTVLGLAFGIWGTARLLRGWGISTIAGVVGGLVLVAGPATRAISGKGEWSTLLAIGVLPWALRAAVRPWLAPWPARAGRLASLAAIIGIMAAASPVLLLVPLALLAVWVLVGDLRAWPAAAAAVPATVLAAGLLFPWIGAVDVGALLEAGPPAYWEPGVVLFAATLLAGIAVLAAAPRPVALVSAWGLIAVAGGGLVARLGEFGPGREIETLGQAIAAIGTAAVVGAGFEAVVRTTGRGGWRRGAAWFGGLAAALVALSTLLIVAPGRAGLPADELTPALGFAVDESGVSRVLLVGPADTLPGDVRQLDGATYRVTSTPAPVLSEAWMGRPLLGDEALDSALRRIIEGETTRAGEALAEFGIRWVVVTGDSPFEEVFAGQLDMLPLGGLRRPTFVSEAPNAYRAITATGMVWVPELPVYVGPAETGGRVRIAENANGRWGPAPWEQDDWANVVSAGAGEASVGAWTDHARQAAGSGTLLLVLLTVAWWGRRRR